MSASALNFGRSGPRVKRVIPSPRLRFRWLALAALVLASPRPAQSQAGGPCPLSDPNARWIQRGISSWERASEVHLHLPPAPLPWILLYDTRCAWHLAPDTTRLTGAVPVAVELRSHGRLVAVWGQPHDGMVRLPTGDSMPAAPSAFAALSSRLEGPYFVLALPDVFRQDSAAAADSLLEERILSVMSHEIVHTRQLPYLLDRLNELGRDGPLPADLDDNVVERRFGADSLFRAAFEQERDLLYDAALEPDEARARELASRALEMVRARRDRFYQHEATIYRSLEDLFLSMEGIAEWVRFKIHQGDPGAFQNNVEILTFMGGRHNEWVQDEGLALLLLVDRFSEGWQERLLDPAMPSPVQELKAALQ